MFLVDYIREVWPHMYWSAGFIALLMVVMAASMVLYAFTRWGVWVCSFLTAGLYLVPFFCFPR